MSLHPETERMMRETYAGRTCNICGRQAVRFVKGRYWCGEHFEKKWGGTRFAGPPTATKHFASGKRYDNDG